MYVTVYSVKMTAFVRNCWNWKIDIFELVCCLVQYFASFTDFANVENAVAFVTIKLGYERFVMGGCILLFLDIYLLHFFMHSWWDRRNCERDVISSIVQPVSPRMHKKNEEPNLDVKYLALFYIVWIFAQYLLAFPKLRWRTENALLFCCAATWALLKINM